MKKNIALAFPAIASITVLLFALAGCAQDNLAKEQEFIKKLRARPPLKKHPVKKNINITPGIEGSMPQSGDLAVVGIPESGGTTNRLFVLTPEGKIRSSISVTTKSFSRADTIASGNNHLYLLDFSQNKVLKLSDGVKAANRLLKFSKFRAQPSLLACGNFIIIGGQFGNLLVVSQDDKAFEVVLPQGEDWPAIPLCVRNPSKPEHFLPAALMETPQGARIYLIDDRKLDIVQTFNAFGYQPSSNWVSAASSPNHPLVFILSSSSDKADGNLINALDLTKGESNWLFRPENLGRRHLRSPVVSLDGNKIAIMATAVELHDRKSPMGTRRLSLDDLLIIVDANSGKELERINLGGKALTKTRQLSVVWDKDGSLFVLMDKKLRRYDIEENGMFTESSLPFQPLSNLALLQSWNP